MKLTKVEIRNFRSIADETISFEEFPCRILIGKNETGKSNVLKAISTLNQDYITSDKVDKDKREKGAESDTVEDEAVIFYFNLEANDINDLYSELQKYFHCADVTAEKIFKTKTACLTLKELLLKKYQLVHRVDLEKKVAYSDLKAKDETECLFCDGWLRIPDDQTEIVTECEVLDKIVQKYSNIIKERGIKPNLEDANFNEFHTLIKDAATNGSVVWSFPEVIFWNNQDDQNLHHAIDICRFMDKPDSYPHFKSMCLCHSDLFKDAKSLGETFRNKYKAKKLRPVYVNIEQKVTSCLKHICDDFKNEKIEIDTSLGPDIIRLSVKREDKGEEYGTPISLGDRSDGFKKFTKLLLSLSLKTHNKEMSNKIILIDEAEIFLHPSSAEYFRDELIRISKDGNIVVFSTHSPFMIDPSKDKILRHIITEKEHEITKLTSPMKGKIYHEELLWRSIGCGILRSLPELSILFEGYNDWKLFKTATHKDSPLKGTEAFSHEINDGKIATANASGVSDFQHLAPLFQAAKSQLFILCDSDTAGQDAKKSFANKKLHGSKNIYTYADLKGSEGQTGEDYIEIEFIQSTFKEYCTKEDLELSKEQQENPKNCLDESKPVLAQINKLLNKMRKKGAVKGKKKPVKEMKNELKELIFKDLKAKDIKQKNYASVLSNLYDKINQFRKEQEDTT